MTARILQTEQKNLIGMRLPMSYSDNRTPQLWAGFMPRRKEILAASGTDLFSVQQYPKGFFERWDPGTVFEKWAALAVDDLQNIPQGMDILSIPAGLYAMFPYKGRSGDSAVFRYIFGEWMPASGYRPDDRPHFELLGERFDRHSPDSEEQIWIPITPQA